MLNFHFGRKYHFVISEKLILAVILLFLVSVFDRLLRRYRATSPKLRGRAYIPHLEKIMMWVYSTDVQHGNLAPPLS